MLRMFIHDIHISDLSPQARPGSAQLYCKVVVDGDIVYQTRNLLDTSSSTCTIPVSREMIMQPWSLVMLVIIDENPANRLPFTPKDTPLLAGVEHARKIPSSPILLYGSHVTNIPAYINIVSLTTVSSDYDLIRPTPLPPMLSNWRGADNYDDLDYDYDYCWKHFSPFLASRGYEICFERCPPHGGFTAWRLPPPFPVAEDPYRPKRHESFAHRHSNREDRFPPSWMSRYAMVKHAYDSYGRLVVLKAVPESNDTEVQILRFLNSETLRPLEANRTIPLLECVESGVGWSFVVLPCWEHSFEVPSIWQVDDFLNRAIQAYEGLAFMHEHLVFHRDISSNNITCNHVGDWQQRTTVPFPTISKFDYRLAFIDFGFSLRFPSGTHDADYTSSVCWGTHGFMAPEVLACHDNPKSYSLGPADVFALASSLINLDEREVDEVKALVSLGEPLYDGIYARRLLLELVPEYRYILENARDNDPLLRPSAQDALLRLCELRERIPASIRYAPPAGYRDYNTLMSDAIDARLLM